MLRSVYGKTLRDLRWSTLAWGGGIAVLILATAMARAIAFPDEESRLRLAAEVKGGLSVVQVVYGPPRSLETLGGFIEWRVLGLAPVLLGLHLIIAATGVMRGAEESRTIELVLASPAGRTRVFLQQVAALGTSLAAAVALVVVAALIAGPLSGDPVLPLVHISGMAANVLMVAAWAGAIALLAAQLFSRRRVAALAASGVMILAHLLNTLPLVATDLAPLRNLSPLRLYSASSPLSNGHTALWALALLALISAANCTLAFVANRRRDLFDSYHLRGRAPVASKTRRVAPGPSRPGLLFRNSLTYGLRDYAGTAAAWGVGLALFAVLMTSLTPNIREAIQEQPSSDVLRRFGGSEREILSTMLFTFLLPPLVAVLGVTLAAGWAADELSQRLELEAAAPIERWRLFIGRLAAAVGAALLALVAVVFATAVAVLVAGTDVPLAAIAGAGAGLLALVALVVSFGFAAASIRPAIAGAACGGFVAASYFADLVIPLLGWPDWTTSMTLFGLYGSPLESGYEPTRIAALAAIALALAAAGALRFQSRDITR